ncbi:hypothetical protein [Flavobacterium sp.]|uniref:hypothetical protein n=1 Tax=Flavobacterium sp. TaxID=239 RepID=UPI0037521419
MGVLKICQYGKPIQEFEVASIKLAKKYIDASDSLPSQTFVYSTFNKGGIENTINIQRKISYEKAIDSR